jgi:carboxypeptidase C (cathepsin A)
MRNCRKICAACWTNGRSRWTNAYPLMKARLRPQRAAIIQRLARYTGLSADYLDRVNLRIEIMRFTKELLRDQRRTVGRLDSRFTGIDRDAGGEMFEYDPGMANTIGPYTAAFNIMCARIAV